MTSEKQRVIFSPEMLIQYCTTNHTSAIDFPSTTVFVL